MTRDTIERKQFNYQIGSTALNFTLRTDVKTELKAFREMMVAAMADIDKELEAFK